MTHRGYLNEVREWVEEARGSLEGWPDIAADLLREGVEQCAIREVLREQEAWLAEAHEWKTCGFPWDEIAIHLREEVAAEWSDVARALLGVGLNPADMLRVVLPLLEGEEPWPVVQAALLDGPEDADYDEVRGVLKFFFLSAAEILGALKVRGVGRERLARRLGLRD